MVVVNTLANTLPINGKGTGEISDSYPNLFAPAGITFAIWGLIYILLLVYSIYQLINYSKVSDTKRQLFNEVGLLFSISSVANALWIFAWHYNVIGLSVILMLVILICLIRINLILKDAELTKMENLTIKLPFTVYFGWITIATIANITTYLVSVNWNRLSLSEVFWTDFMLLVGAILGAICVLYFNSLAYGFVIIWAYIGIIIKHLSPDKFDGKYPSVIVTAFVGILLIIAAQILLILARIKERRN
jgi:hypothetical protein